MANLEVIHHPNEVLRRKAKKVTEFTPDLQVLIEDMIDTMRAEPGVGLAAPQVGVSLRVIVVEYGDEEDEEKPARLFAVINPEMKVTSEEKIIGVEGCLSVPGFAGDVERSAEITIVGLNRYGKRLRLKLKGWLARIFQHELDHLDGVLYIDRAQRVWKLEPEEEAPSAAD
jgi:peptide deformylase